MNQTAPTADALRAAGVVDPEWIAMVPPTRRNPLGYYRGPGYPPVNPRALSERPAWAAVAARVSALRGR